MGFNPFKIIGKGVKAAVSVVRTAAPLAASLIPGGATALGAVNAVSGAISRGGQTPASGATRIVSGGATAQRRLPSSFEEGAKFVSTTAGPATRTGTQQTEPAGSVLDKIRMDLENVLSGVASSFGRDVARGVTQGAESEGGLPLNVRGNLPIILGVGAFGIAAVVLVATVAGRKR